MQPGNQKKIQQPLIWAKRLLWIGIPLCLLTPLIFTQSFIGPNFEKTGQIGDTIGGISSPYINLLGAILVFLALKAQIEANLLIQKQIDDQETEKKKENENKQLNKFYENLKLSIDNFSFSTLDPNSFGTGQTVHSSEAIYKLFNDFFCDAHQSEDEIKCNPKLTELLSILEICDLLLNRIKNSIAPDKETLWILTKHQFEYRIFPRIKSEFPDNLKKYDCSTCLTKHGLPDNICKLLIDIDSKLKYGL